MAQLLGTSIKAIHSYEQAWRSIPAWEFKAGDLCWFINGTVCEGMVQKGWQEKMKICQSCEVFSYLVIDRTTK